MSAPGTGLGQGCTNLCRPAQHAFYCGTGSGEGFSCGCTVDSATPCPYCWTPQPERERACLCSTPPVPGEWHGNSKCPRWEYGAVKEGWYLHGRESTAEEVAAWAARGDAPCGDAKGDYPAGGDL